MKLLTKRTRSAVSNDVGGIESNDLGLSSCCLAIVTMPRIISKVLQLDLVDLFANEVQTANWRYRAIVEPEQMRRIKIVLHDVLPVDVIIKNSINWVR